MGDQEPRKTTPGVRRAQLSTADTPLPLVAPDAFVARQRFEEKHPDALAIYCSDGRFTNSVEELLQSLGFPRLDTLTMPGGPALLNLWSAQFSDMDASSRAAQFLIRGHTLTHIVLFAHQGCGYYRARYGALEAQHVYERQLHDLRVAAHGLRIPRPELDVRAFFARPERGQVHFDLVRLDGHEPTMG